MEHELTGLYPMERTMKVRIVSDLHLEFGSFNLPVIHGEDSMVLILAGDIFLGEKPWLATNFFDEITERFAQVIMIAGNHEFYQGEFPTTLDTIRTLVREYTNIDFLEKETLVINDVAFIGATLWTNMNNNDWFAVQAARYNMNDYAVIKNSIRGGQLHPHDLTDDHAIAKKFIFNEITSHQNAGRRTVVITHHLPCQLSVNEKYRQTNDPVNFAYYTELSNEIFDAQPTLWVHGHTHDSFDYFLGNTRVICNPRGYVGYELNKDFDPYLVVEIPVGPWPNA